MNDEHRGIGDRWLHGERIEGVAYAHLQPVAIASGDHAGALGSVALLVRVRPDPVYLVQLASGGRPVRVPQAALRAVS